VFHEWSTTISVVLGVLALVCIIIGVILTSLQSKEEKNAEQAGNFKKGIIILLISTVGYLVITTSGRYGIRRDFTHI
jgi:glucose uptake protein